MKKGIQRGNMKGENEDRRWETGFRNLRQFFFSALLFLLFCSPLFAQDANEVDPMPIKLRGQVLNLEDEQPVPFAFVLNYL